MTQYLQHKALQDNLIELLQEQCGQLRLERDTEAAEARMLRAKLRKGERIESPERVKSDLRKPLRRNGLASSAPPRIAAVVDEFTASCLAPSCNMCAVDVREWRQQLTKFEPELLFVESAWHGNSGQWSRKIHQLSSDLIELLKWCKDEGVPTVFWNKEDPVHFDTFINTAKRFDYVFTTAFECISAYKTLLGHDRVYLLPFWGQPAIHSPVEKYEREKSFCFAGAYYARYPERQRDFDSLIGGLSEFMPVEIYDRNYGKDDPNYMFPEHYRGLIRGGLPYDQIDRAYKGYDFGINLNSVKQSQSMFARRVFDLMLSNTHVVSNFSRGLRLLFGDLVTSTDSGQHAFENVRSITSDDGEVSKQRMLRLIALRKVMLEHTAENRLEYIFKKVFGHTFVRQVPEIVVVASVHDEQELDRIWGSYSRQRWAAKRLVLVVDGRLDPRSLGVIRGKPDVAVLSPKDASCCNPDEAWPDASIAVMTPFDFYGENYLTDAALGFLYSSAEVVGKGTWYESAGGEISLRRAGQQYRWIDRLPIRRSVAKSSAYVGSPLSVWLEDVAHRQVSGESCLSLDEFSYVANSTIDYFPELAEDAVDVGLPVATLLEKAEEIMGVAPQSAIKVGYSASKLLSVFGKSRRSGSVCLDHVGGALVVRSELAAAERRYVYAEHTLSISELYVERGEITFNLIAIPGLQLELVLIYLSADGDRIGHLIRPFGRNHNERLPVGTTDVRIGFRVVGSGVARITGLSLEEIETVGFSAPRVGSSRYLVLSNSYPSVDDLYRNGFVHRRVLAYRDAGEKVDVFVLGRQNLSQSYEFEDVDVTVGGESQLAGALSANYYSSILVHFLDRTMWHRLREQLSRSRVIIWVHGAEVQPWHRRKFNYTTDESLAKAKQASEHREALWRDVFTHDHPNLHFVFVSRYLADEVMGDYNIALAETSYSVIHNIIDGDLFPYEEKNPKQRFKILSIRPFASRKYANDLTVQAIQLLMEKPYFEELEFRLVGTGPLLEETVEPVRGIHNVLIDPRFLTQSQISELHKEYGVFLNPTRWDSQGVSRDEAMASGLVPVTTNTSAIPEFLDESCGFAVPEEDAQALADAIATLVEDPDTFVRLSRHAALRPRRQSNFESTIMREVDLFSTSTPRIVCKE